MIALLLILFGITANAEEYVVHCDGVKSPEICVVTAVGFIPAGKISKKPKSWNCNPCRSEYLEMIGGKPVLNLAKQAEFENARKEIRDAEELKRQEELAAHEKLKDDCLKLSDIDPMQKVVKDLCLKTFSK